MGGDFGADSGAASNIVIFQALLKPFIGVGCLSLPGVTMNGGIVYFSALLIILSYVASWCIFKLVECSEVIMKAEIYRNMLQRKMNEQYNNQQVTNNNKDNKSLLPTDSNGINGPRQVKLFEKIPGYDAGDILECDRVGVSLPTFTDIGTAAYGYWGGVLTDISIIITQIGGCTAYVIFISESMHRVTGLPIIAWVGIMWLPFVLLACIRNMANLAKVASLGNLVYIYTLGVIFYQGFKSHCCLPREDMNLGDYTYLPAVFGSLSFALEGIALVLPIKQRMATPKSFTLVMTSAMATIFVIYMAVAILGYLFYGSHTQSPVIGNLEPGVLADSVKIALSISLYITFGLQCFPVSHFFDQLVDRRVYKLNFKQLREEASKLPQDEAPMLSPRVDGEGEPTETVDLTLTGSHPQTVIHLSDEQLVPAEVRMKRFWLNNLHRVLYVSLCCGIAILFPKFDLIIALFGSFTNALLAYIFPALFWVRICSPELFTGKLWFPYSREGEYFDQSEVLDAAEDDNLNNSASKNGSIQHVSETDPLFGSESSSSGSKKGKKAKLHQKYTTCGKFVSLFFPYAVAILGSIASGVGVTTAIKNLVEEFGK